MNVVCVLQARMGSTRLPGKALMDLAGTPMLRLQLDRLRRDEHLRVVVATTTEVADDAIVECAEAAGVPVVRGDEDDVLGRFLLVLDRHPADHVVRLTADCPLTDADLVRAAVGEHLRSGADYTSNTLIRTFPDGLDVEVLTAEALRTAAAEASDPVEREHVTPFVYRRSSRFGLRALRTPERLGHLRWTVDTADDLEPLRQIIGEHPARRQLGWRVLLGELELHDRPPLVEGFEPAVPSELPQGVGMHPDDYNDPARQLVTFRHLGLPAGWLQVTVVDGVADVQGGIDEQLVPAAQRAFDAFVESTLLIVGGDLDVRHAQPRGQLGVAS